MTLRIRGREFRWGERTYIMGVLNLTPDSFSGNGIYQDVKEAVRRAKEIEAEGADIIDIGGESTRPGASPISVEEELSRVLPALKRIVEEVSLPISIDTYKYEVAKEALDAGAQIINDIWGLKKDPRLAELASERDVPIILVSNQRDRPCSHIMPQVISDLRRSIELALKKGVSEEKIIIDPGIGFGKTPEQNLEVLRRLDELKVLGRPILVGTSRKFFLGASPERRIEATAATVAISIVKGADIVRVHDVGFMVKVCRMTDVVIRRCL